MKRNRLLVLIFLLLASFTVMMAQQVSADEAMARARAFMQSGKGPRRAPGKAVPQLKLAYTQTRTPDEKVCFYVFNYSDDSGFIIMGGDESAREVLAYSDAGSFDYDKAPENFKWWLSQYQDDISYAMDNSAKMLPRKVNANSTNRSDVEPLIKTTWDQSEPYWNAVNSAYQAQGGTDEFVTGCVATAMAQVMKYHEWPVTGTGSHSYTCKTITGFKPSVDFSATTYLWGNMIDDYSDDYTTDEANAVATLMYHAGVSVNMDYGTSASGGSGAYISDVEGALRNYFGYDKTIRYEYRNAVNNDAWEKMIYGQLAKKLPVIYGGQSGSGGHCFVYTNFILIAI